MLALLAAFWVASADVQRESLWFDEGYTLYIIRDEGQPPDRVTGVARFVWHSLTSAVARARADVHPPLYFVALDVWTLLAGESVLAVRLLSVWFGLIGVAATGALGKRLFGYRAGLVAMLALGTASMVVYYSREARMYSLLLALAALAVLAYWRWLRRPTAFRTVIYGAVMAALLYTHYAGVFIILAQGLHLLLTRPRRVWRWLIPAGFGLLLYVPWLPALWWQYTVHGHPSALPFADTQTALDALLFFVTGGYLALYVIPIALNLPRLRRDGPALLMLALWLLVTPAGLLLLNTAIPSIFQVRYAIGALPAGALLLAAGVDSVPDWVAAVGERVARQHRVRGQWLPSLAIIGLVGALVYTQLTVYPFVWPPNPPWEAVVRGAAETRHPLEPALTAIPEASPAAYYDRLFGLRRGLALNLGWRWQESYEMAGYVQRLADSDSVWVMMPGTFASTWDAARDLLADRHVGYRDGVDTMIFYRFDRGKGDDLHFRFGDLLGYDGGIQNHLYARAGENFCFKVELQALADVADDYAIDFYLTQGYGTIRALTTLRPGAYAAGQPIDLAPCIAMPADTPAGPHHLRMRAYNPANNQPAPVIEGDKVYWGAEIILALVSVE